MQQMQFLLSILLIFLFLPHAASLAKPTPIDNGTPDALTKQTTHHLAQSETANDFKTSLSFLLKASHGVGKSKGIALYRIGRLHLDHLLGLKPRTSHHLTSSSASHPTPLLSTIATSTPTQVFDYFNRSAHEGTSEAHRVLGMVYSLGLLGIDKDEVASLLHYHYAAASGHTQAAMAMGFRHLHGIGVTKSCARAVLYYELAANTAIDAIDQNVLQPWNLPRLFRLGDGGYVKSTGGMHGLTGDVVVTGASGSGTPSDTEVMQYLKYNIEKNDPSSYSMLGLIHYHGTRGQPRDVKKAYRLLKTAAVEYGNVEAYADLGYMLLQGFGEDGRGGGEGSEDGGEAGGKSTGASNSRTSQYDLAFKYFTLAAKGGNAEGANGLGYMHLNGLGVPVSFTKAKGHFETAAQARSVHGIYNMGAMYMTPPPPMTKAEQESAAAGNNNNNNNKEVLFDFDFKKAVAHFKVAAKAGHIHAMHKLGHMTVHGIGVEDEQSSSGSGGGGGVHTFPHCEEAVGLFKKVSERGPTSALITEAEDYHMAGNTFASLWHYTKAADLGYEVAQANAAYMYEQLTTVELEHLGMDTTSSDWKRRRRRRRSRRRRQGRAREKGEKKGEGEGEEKGKEKKKVEEAGHQKKGKRKSGRASVKEQVGKEDSSSSTRRNKWKKRYVPFSLRMWKWAAKQSNVHANIRVGDMYFYGLQGISVDMNKAVRNYQRATTYGSAQSMFNLGWHYQFGVGVPLDFHLSKRYYDRAMQTAPQDATYPSRFGLLSLFVYSSWTSCSTWKILLTNLWKGIDQWMKGVSYELSLGDIPMYEIVPLGNDYAPSIGLFTHWFTSSDEDDGHSNSDEETRENFLIYACSLLLTIVLVAIGWHRRGTMHL